MAPRLGKDGITVKQRKLVKGLAEGKTMTQAALDAGLGGTPNSARNAGSRALQNGAVAGALEAALDRAGASLDKSAQVIAAAHKATTVKVFNDPENGITYATPLVDHNTRMKAAELNLKARGVLHSNDDASGQVLGVGVFILKGLRDRGIIEGEKA